MNSQEVRKEEKLPGSSLAFMQYVVLAVLLVLIGKMWQLQILDTEDFKALAEQNRIRKIPILAPRGKLYDREGRILVDNYPSVSCFLVREQGRDIEKDLPLISRGLHLDMDQLHSILKRYRFSPAFQPIPLKQDITPDEEAFVEAHRNELPELETIGEQRRLYPRDGFASHLIGYVGEVSEEMLNDPKYAYYEPGDTVGKAGIEQSYDPILRGENGYRSVVVDSHGKEVGRLRTAHAQAGKDLRLTIDIDIQRAAELALGEKSGAVVALDPRTGEVLAMVSHPSYDPNAFSVRIGREEWNRLISDPAHPLMNKAIQDQLAPGSTFKILMSVAGLQQGIAQNLRVNCPGGATFYGHFSKCHGRHGTTDLTHAIEWSCDTFFYSLADKLGINTIAKYAKQFGFGQRTGIDLPNEMAGIVPSEEWKLKNYHSKWYAGETISVGIGQGAVTATPLQLARAIGGIASDGHLKRPHVVMTNQLPADYQHAVLDTYTGAGDINVPIDSSNWERITDAMALVTQPGGTAAGAHLEGIDFAGKTGTAQVASHDAIGRMGGGRNTVPNAWFVGVAPRRNPEIVVAVLWEHGAEGPYAARVAAPVIQAYVNKQRRLEKNLQIIRSPQQMQVGAVWSNPSSGGVAKVSGGHFALSKALSGMASKAIP